MVDKKENGKTVRGGATEHDNSSQLGLLSSTLRNKSESHVKGNPLEGVIWSFDRIGELAKLPGHAMARLVIRIVDQPLDLIDNGIHDCKAQVDITAVGSAMKGREDGEGQLEKAE